MIRRPRRPPGLLVCWLCTPRRSAVTSAIPGPHFKPKDAVSNPEIVQSTAILPARSLGYDTRAAILSPGIERPG